MPYQVPDALLHAMSGTELSRVRTELRLLPREPIKQVCSRRGEGRHCYAIKCHTITPLDCITMSAPSTRVNCGCLTTKGSEEGAEQHVQEKADASSGR
jgi:hypothetical protein